MQSKHRMSTTVLKAFKVLDVVASKHGQGASLADVSGSLGISKSTAYRYIITLEELRVIERDEADRFFLGPKLIELGGLYLNTNSLLDLSERFLNQLTDQTQETAHLAVPSGSGVVYIAKVDSPHAIQMASRIGGRMPMHSTSLGKAILAHYPPDRLDEVIAEGLTARTSHTIVAPEPLREELERVRSQGFAIDNQENELGVRCVGAPVFDHANEPIAAISVSGPANRVTCERALEWGPLVRDTAFELSRRTGHRR